MRDHSVSVIWIESALRCLHECNLLQHVEWHGLFCRNTSTDLAWDCVCLGQLFKLVN